MRAKELKNILNNLPDETEIVVRGQTHKLVKGGRTDAVIIASASTVLSSDEQKLILNPMRRMKTSTWVPERDEQVFCLDCMNYEKLDMCRRKGRECKDCNSSNCCCNNCYPFNVDAAVAYKDRPMYEKKEIK